MSIKKSYDLIKHRYGKDVGGIICAFLDGPDETGIKNKNKMLDELVIVFAGAEHYRGTFRSSSFSGRILGAIYGLNDDKTLEKNAIIQLLSSLRKIKPRKKNTVLTHDGLKYYFTR